MAVTSELIDFSHEIWLRPLGAVSSGLVHLDRPTRVQTVPFVRFVALLVRAPRVG